MSYLDTYFEQRNLQKTLSMFNSCISGFGTGIDEKAFDIDSFKKLYKRDIGQVPEKIQYLIISSHIHSPSHDVGIAAVELNLKTQIHGQELKLNHLRLSMVLTLNEQNNNWMVDHMHISFPTEIHSEGEAYPLKELEDRNQLLEKMVEERTKSLNESNKKLFLALEEIKTLKGILPICMYCKKIRDDKGYWNQIESYINKHSDAEFSHGICDTCLGIHYPDYKKKE